MTCTLYDGHTLLDHVRIEESSYIAFTYIKNEIMHTIGILPHEQIIEPVSSGFTIKLMNVKSKNNCSYHNTS